MISNFAHFGVVAIIALLFTALSIPQIVRVATKRGLLDTPNSRSSSKIVVPTLGGIAIFIGLRLSATIGGDGFPFDELKYIFASILIIFFVGIKDDLVGISPRSKLFAQALTIFIVFFFADLRIDNLFGFLGIYEINIFYSFLITFFVGIVIINAFNLIDGIDGLASGISVLIGLVLGVWFTLVNLPEYALLAFSLVGSCVAFFTFNVFGKANKIFMGDSGSLLIGMVMFALLVKFNQVNATYSGAYSIQSAPAVLLGIFSYPLLDVIRVFFLRTVVCKRSPFSADKNHIHHRLLALGFTHLQSTLIIMIFNFVLIVFAFTFQSIGVLSLTILLFSIALLVSYIPEIVLYYRKTISPFDKNQTLLYPLSFLSQNRSKIA